MRSLVVSPNYAFRWNKAHEIFKQDLFDAEDVVFFGPGYPLWEERTYSALDLMSKFEADVLFIFHSKHTKEWLFDIHLVKNSINYQLDYYPGREQDVWRDDFLILNNFSLVVFPNKFMVDQFIIRNKGRKLPLTFYLPFGINTDIFKPRNNQFTERPINLLSIMSLNKVEYPNREAIFKVLHKANIQNIFLHPVTGGASIIPLDNYISFLQDSKLVIHSCDRYRSAAFRCFEALACGSVLLTDAPSDFNSLNFEKGIHYVEYSVDRINNLPKLIERLLKDEEMLARIAENGMNLINQYHTNKHRAFRLWSFIKGIL